MSGNTEKVETTHRFLEQVYGFKVVEKAAPGTPAAELEALERARDEGLITADELVDAVGRLIKRAHADPSDEGGPHP